MKKSLIIWPILIASAISGFTQGTIEFNNLRTGQVRAPIYGMDPAAPFIMKRGNPPSGTPAGTTIYGGAPLEGTGFSVQVFGGSTRTAESELVASSAILNFRTGSAAGFISNPGGFGCDHPGCS